MIAIEKTINTEKMDAGIKVLQHHFHTDGRVICPDEIQKFALREHSVRLTDGQCGIALMVYCIRVAYLSIMKLISDHAQVVSLEQFLEAMPVPHGGAACCGVRSQVIARQAYVSTYRFLCITRLVSPEDQLRVTTVLSDTGRLEERIAVITKGLLKFSELDELFVLFSKQHTKEAKRWKKYKTECKEYGKFERAIKGNDTIAAG